MATVQCPGRPQGLHDRAPPSHEREKGRAPPPRRGEPQSHVQDAGHPVQGLHQSRTVHARHVECWTDKIQQRANRLQH